MKSDNITKAVARAIKQAGGGAKLAASLGLGGTTPYMWLARGSVPAEHCASIEAITGVMRWELRPKDWYRIWPELRRRKAAPLIRI